MEDLFPALIVLIGIVGSIISSSKKKKEQQAAEVRRKAAVAARVQFAQQKLAQTAAVPVQPLSAPAPAKTIQPQVHAHLQPDCDIHDAPGSLGVASAEGKDPCHEDQLTHDRTYAAAPQEKSGLSLDWTGENMVKAFVMQEVLTRPAVRNRAR